MSRPSLFPAVVVVLAVLVACGVSRAQDAPASAATAMAPAHDAHAMHGDMASQAMPMAMPAPAGSAPASAHDAHAMPMPIPATAASSPSSAHDGHAMHGMPMPLDGHDGQAASASSPTPSPAMAMGAMQGGEAPPGARDPDYSDGIRYPRDHDAHMHGDARVGMLAIDRLEWVHAADGDSGALEGQAWYGGDLDKATLKFEGDAAGGRLADSRLEALWSHAVSGYWDTQLGVRRDGGEGPSRTWAAFGVQGLAPYWFDVQATVYAGAGGRTAARVELEYEVLFTQRLILTPKLELNAYGKDDPARGIGRGLSDAGLGLRLRYEIRRRFAPYVGVTWTQRFGATADLARAGGGHAAGHAWVAGVRVWW